MHSDGRFRSQFTMPCDTSTRPLRAPCHRWSNRALWPASSLGRGPFRIPSRSTAASCSSIPWNLRSRCGGLVPQSSATALYRNRATRTQSAATTLRAACRCVVVRNPISECYTLLLRRVPRPVPAMRAYLGGLHALLFLHPLILLSAFATRTAGLLQSLLEGAPVLAHPRHVRLGLLSCHM